MWIESQPNSRSSFITFKESEAAGSEQRRRPLPALLSRRGFFLEPLAAWDCARAGADAGVLDLRAEGPRRPPPSSSPEEDERTTTGGRFPIGGGGEMVGLWGFVFEKDLFAPRDFGGFGRSLGGGEGNRENGTAACRERRRRGDEEVRILCGRQIHTHSFSPFYFFVSHSQLYMKSTHLV